MLTGQLSIFDLMEPDPVDGPVIDAGTLNDPGDFESMANARDAHFREFNVNRGNWKPYRGWSFRESSGKDSPHPATCFYTDLRCQHYQHRGECSCIGNLTYRVYCHGCDHWSEICESENGAWESHLDHCWPGWRELPVVETTMKNYNYVFHWPKDYPETWKVPGAPVRDCRGELATRHVPGASPFGGVKAAAVRGCEKHNPKGGK